MGIRRALFFLIFLVIGSCVVSAAGDVPESSNDKEYTTENIILSSFIAFLKFVLVIMITGATFVSFFSSLYHFTIKPLFEYGADEVHYAQLGIVEEVVRFDKPENEL